MSLSTAPRRGGVLLPAWTLLVSGFLVAGILAEPATSQTQLFRLEPRNDERDFGFDVADATDLDGDGVADVFVGMPGAGPLPFQAGKARVHSGADGSILFTLNGTDYLSLHGYAIDAIGDADGDGVSELVVGAPGYWAACCSGLFWNGKFEVFSGASQVRLFRVTGEQNNWSNLGVDVAGLGDVDGDAIPDVAAAAHSIWIYSGPREYVDVWSGAGSFLLTVPDTSLPGASSVFATAIAGPGDLDADGFADLVVGDPGSDQVAFHSGVDGGLIRVYAGASGGGFGAALAVHEDVDGDGWNDLLVGGPAAGGKGAVDLVSGAQATLLRQWIGNANGERFGCAVGSLDDVDGDGVAEILVGAEASDLAGVDAGRAVVLCGAIGSVLSETLGPSAGSLFGAAVAAVDVDRDGTLDPVVGAPEDVIVAGFKEGSVGIYAGCPGSFHQYGAGLAGTGGFVPALTGMGCPLVGGVVSLEFAEGIGGAQGGLLWGANGPASIPALGGTLLVAPPIGFVPLTLAGTSGSPGAGTASLPIVIPPLAAFDGIVLQFQGWFFDVGAPFGVAHTNGLAMTIRAF